MKTLAIAWISAWAAFALVSGYLLLNEENINAPGELAENVFAVGSILAMLLLLVTAVLVLVARTKK